MSLNKTIRPWGEYIILEDTPKYKSKKIIINPGQRISYQFHTKRSEVWVIVSGTGILTLDGAEKKVSYGDAILIPVYSKHRIHNNSNEKLVFIEVQTGQYFDEDDITRIDDDYNRI